jgi:long-chain fatty acid transport protein
VSDAGTFELAIPMEAKIGFRYRHPRRGARPQQFIAQHGSWARDSMSQDVFDLELDVTWANGTQIDDVKIRINPNTLVNLGGGVQAVVPVNGDVPHDYKHVVGVRLGGEYVIIPDLFALRAGLFFESPGQDAKDLFIDFHQGWKLGGGAGATLRLDRFDISLAYQHTHWGKLDNGGQGTTKALSGDATRPDGRSIQSINGGSTTASLNEIALGVGVHW